MHINSNLLLVLKNYKFFCRSPKLLKTYLATFVHKFSQEKCFNFCNSSLLIKQTLGLSLLILIYFKLP